MATPIAMPKLGMTMQEGTVVEWPRAVGAAVEKGDIVVVIETEKTQVDVEATASGVLRHLYVAAGETAPCGTLLGALTATGTEPFDADAFRREHERAGAGAAPPAGAAAPGDAGTPRRAGAQRAGSGRDPARTDPGRDQGSDPDPARMDAAPVTPAARALARGLGITLADIAGTGPGGRVTKEDVAAFAARRERLVAVRDGVMLEVLREGDGDPVVFLPGFGVGAASFAPQLHAVACAGTFRALALHPRGIGASDAPAAEAYAIAEGAGDAAALLATLGARAHVVGASLGAAIALELALRVPDRVRSLTLVTPFLHAGPRLRSVAAGWCAVARHGGVETLSRTLLPWLFSERALADDAGRERMRRGLAAALSVAPPDTLDRWAAGMAAWPGPPSAELRGLQVPTLVIAAGADLLTPHGDALARAIPRATVRVLADVGHAAASEASDAVNEALLAHLARH
ncbi:MAG: alpha/beta fold hydrolase [Deltaproteobacteria bacterium]|nr:alpha/beta fold hydrolase [Deltaproteobacteria bacterium]